MNTNTEVASGMPNIMVATNDLLDFLNLVKPVVDTRLDMITLAYEFDSLSITYTSRLTCATCEIMAKGSISFAKPISVLYKDFLALVKNSGSYATELSWSDNKLTVVSEISSQTCAATTETTRVGFSADCTVVPFHSLPIIESFPTMLKIVKSDNPRNYGTVIYVDATDNKLCFVGTDGFRLAKSEHWLTSYGEFHGTCLMADTCKVLLIAAKSKQEMKVGISEDKECLVLRVGSAILKFKTPVFKYPDYQQVIPAGSYGQDFTVKVLASTVKAALQTSDKSHAVMLTRHAITTKNIGKSDSSYSVVNCFPAKNLETNMSIAVNGKFLLDALLATKELTGQICIHATKDDEPVKLILGSVEVILVPIKQK